MSETKSLCQFKYIIVPRRVNIVFATRPNFIHPIMCIDAYGSGNTNCKSEDRNPVDNTSYCELAYGNNCLGLSVPFHSLTPYML